VQFSPTNYTGFSWDSSSANNGGKTAAQLCTDRGNGWRLPTEKEIMQAYVDGSYFNTILTNSYYIWTNTLSGPYHAIGSTQVYGNLEDGQISQGPPSQLISIKCVR
jgi:hypothetical protein